MESKIAEARTSIVESLKLVQDVYRKKPDPFMYFVQIVMESKSDEIINIFYLTGDYDKSLGHAILSY